MQQIFRTLPLHVWCRPFSNLAFKDQVHFYWNQSFTSTETNPNKIGKIELSAFTSLISHSSIPDQLAHSRIHPKGFYQNRSKLTSVHCSDSDLLGRIRSFLNLTYKNQLHFYWHQPYQNQIEFAQSTVLTIIHWPDSTNLDLLGRMRKEFGTLNPDNRFLHLVMQVVFMIISLCKIHCQNAVSMYRPHTKIYKGKRKHSKNGIKPEMYLWFIIK